MDTLHTAMTPEGKAWVLRALDPFHDTNVGLAGIPDHDTEPTAIQYLRKKVSIQKPASAVTGTWQCHITTIPTMTTDFALSLQPSSTYGSYYCGTESSAEYGTVTVVTAPDGVSTFPSIAKTDLFDGGQVFTAHSIEEGSMANSNASSMKKIIGGGFEVHNDTAELTRQGNVGVYNSPQSLQKVLAPIRSATIGEPANYHPGGVIRGRAPPSTISEMSLYPSCRNWAASEGCYVPFRLNLADGTEFKPVTTDILCMPKFDESGANGDSYEVGFMQHNIGVHVGDPLDENFLTRATGWRTAALQTTGAYFSGLSQETTLTLDILFIVEIAPTAANPSMLSMVSKTAPYDPIAMRMYCNMLQSLPPGVPVHENAKGDWWRTVLKTATKVSKIAAPVVALSGHPVAAGAITAAGELLASVPDAKKKKKKPQPGKTSVHLTPLNSKRR